MLSVPMPHPGAEQTCCSVTIFEDGEVINRGRKEEANEEEKSRKVIAIRKLNRLKARLSLQEFGNIGINMLRELGNVQHSNGTTWDATAQTRPY